MGKLSPSMVDKAAHANLVAYCEAHGIALKREGKEFIVKANDSIYISAEQPWKWYRHSTGNGGKAVDFAMQYLGMDFRSAVFEMLGKLPEIEIAPTESVTYKPDTHTDQKRVIAYLCKKRKLDYQLVTNLIRDGKLRQDKNGNCVFGIKDTTGKMIGAELHGTGEKRFKGQATEQQGFGFQYSTGAKIKMVLYVESAIDLLSLYELHKHKLTSIGTLLVSMGGLKPAVVTNYRSIYPDAKHYCAVDADEKGIAFALEMEMAHRKPEHNFKDWNEELCYVKEEKCLLEKTVLENALPIVTP